MRERILEKIDAVRDLNDSIFKIFLVIFKVINEQGNIRMF